MDFTCITPSRGRNSLLKNFIHSFASKAAQPNLVEFWLAFDIDDKNSQEIDDFAVNTGYNINYIKVPRTDHFHRDYYNRLATLARGKYIVGLNDECEVVQNHWDAIIKNEVESFLINKPDRIAYVYVNDSTHQGDNQFKNRGSCFPVLTREAIEACGCYIPDEIKMWGGDLMLFGIYSSLCDCRILDIQDKIQFLHHSCHNLTRSEDDNTHRIRRISGVIPPIDTAFYAGRINSVIRKFKEKKARIQEVPSHFVLADFKNAVTTSTNAPFMTGMQLETINFDDFGIMEYAGIPFNVLNTQDKNAIVLCGPLGSISKNYPLRVEVPCDDYISKIHLLGLTAGWGYQGTQDGYNKPTVSMKIHLKYDGGSEVIELINGLHITDFINKSAHVNGSMLVERSKENNPIRYASFNVKTKQKINSVEFFKPNTDITCPIILAMTYEKKKLI